MPIDNVESKGMIYGPAKKLSREEVYAPHDIEGWDDGP
jgi:hypothetical protein